MDVVAEQARQHDDRLRHEYSGEVASHLSAADQRMRAFVVLKGALSGSRCPCVDRQHNRELTAQLASLTARVTARDEELARVKAKLEVYQVNAALGDARRSLARCGASAEVRVRQDGPAGAEG